VVYLLTGTGRFFYYKLKCWGCELNDSLTPTFIIEPYYKLKCWGYELTDSHTPTFIIEPFCFKKLFSISYRKPTGKDAHSQVMKFAVIAG